MSQLNYNRKQLQDLKAAAKELHELSLGVERAINTAAEHGELQPAKDAFAELQLKTAEYKKFRATLSPEVLFVAKYNVEVHGPHEVSFVLPKGISRIEMLKEAQELVWDRRLIVSSYLTKWGNNRDFQTKAKISEAIRIDGHVEGGDKRTRAEQEALLTERNLRMPSTADLAAAFVAHYVATKEPLFGFFKNHDHAFVVRAASSALAFDSDGLQELSILDNGREATIAVAAYAYTP